MSDFKPYLVSWNLTKRCNLSCPHCYIDSSASKLQTHNSELTNDEARSVVDELSAMNSQLMLILTGGEPMLREDIFDIVEYSSKAGFITVLGSNGTLLTEENLRTLKNAGLKGLGISIDSVNRDCHDSFRGLDSAWDMSTSAIMSARKLGIETQMDVTLTDGNSTDIEKFIELGASLDVKAVNLFFLVCTGRAMETDITEYNYEVALRRIVELSRTEKRLMVRARCAPHIYRVMYNDGFEITSGTRGCLAGRYYMRIDPEGNITPCPYMSISVGNIKERRLSEIWSENTLLKQLREGAYKGKCGECEYTEICGGCRARALVEKSDFMEEDNLCTYTPVGKGKISLSEGLKTELQWEEKAKERIKGIPFFMQGMVTKAIETRARDMGISIISLDMIDELKSRYQMKGD